MNCSLKNRKCSNCKLITTNMKSSSSIYLCLLQCNCTNIPRRWSACTLCDESSESYSKCLQNEFRLYHLQKNHAKKLNRIPQQPNTITNPVQTLSTYLPSHIHNFFELEKKTNWPRYGYYYL